MVVAASTTELALCRSRSALSIPPGLPSVSHLILVALFGSDLAAFGITLVTDHYLIIMPLTDISPNVRRHGSQRSGRQVAGRPSPKTASSVPPRGIQSMLRTTTETGDIGQFAVRPSRLPRSTSRLAMNRPRSGSFDSSFIGLRNPNATPYQSRSKWQGPRQMRSFTNLPRPDTVRSNLTFYHQNPRLKTSGSGPYPSGREARASPSLGSRSLYSHRSLMTLRSQRDYRSMHSTSPGRLAGQMRRPGQRAPSPAFSDIPGDIPRFRPPYTRAGSVTSSPSLAYPNRRRNLGYNPDMNNSFTSFARLPSPAIPLSYACTARSRPGSRTNTPVSFRDPRGASSVSLASSMRELPKSPTGPSTPAYYDYSESFVEEECFPPEGGQILPFGIDQTIHEHGPPPTHLRAQTPFGLRPGSLYNPVKLPTSHNRTPSEVSRPTSPVISPAVVPRRTSSLVPLSIAVKQDVVQDKASLPKALERSAGKPPSAGCENDQIKDPDPRRASTVSNASRLSSHSSTFFPNANRSTRNLISLAARVHSPDVDQVHMQASLCGSLRVEESFGRAASTVSHAPKPALQSWQLPSLNFRPFSLISSIQCPSDRPRTSAGATARAGTEVISPTPERPMSSQSRKRFSKILDIDDSYPDTSMGPAKRSFNSLNFLSLKKVDEIPESSYPARFSIPPFCHLKAITVSNKTKSDSGGILSTPEVVSSKTTNPERSTVESLLDRHIEALGLMPEAPNEGDAASDLESGLHFPSGATSDTFKALAVSLERKNITRSYSLATAPSNIDSTLGSSERHRLMPRRLFANVDFSTSQLPSLQSAPQFLALMPEYEISDRPSYGWQTLASSSQLNSMPSITRTCAAQTNYDMSEAANKIQHFKARRRSALSLSPTSSSGWSQSVEGLSHLDGGLQVQQRSREKFDRQTSHRRRQRIQLKLKRNSRSLASIAAKDIAERLGSAYTTPQASSAYVQTQHDPSLTDGLAELDSISVAFPPEPSISRKPTSPKIPHRWSSLINVVQQPIEKSVDVARKSSVRTMRSHPSVSSLAEPINSTRLAAQGAHMVSQISISMLAPPELGPPLHAATLDLSIPYAPEPSTVGPTTRGTKSFFSDDSSGLQTKPGTSGGTGTLRNKLGLHSLRNVMPSSPRTSVIRYAFSAKTPNNHFQVHHSCNNIAGIRKSFDEDIPLEGTVGMSEFAYRKRKMMQKVKDWWMRQCVQKRIVETLRRKKPTQE